MGNIFMILLTVIFLQQSAEAADRVRIGFEALVASYISLPPPPANPMLLLVRSIM